MAKKAGENCRRRMPPLLPLMLLLGSSLPCEGAIISISPGGNAFQASNATRSKHTQQ